MRTEDKDCRIFGGPTMYSEQDIDRAGMVSTGKFRAMQYVVGQIRELSTRGNKEISVRQERRYIDADAISVDGVWYSVVTTPFVCGIKVLSSLPGPSSGWYYSPSQLSDDNGRWRDDATNEQR